MWADAAYGTAIGTNFGVHGTHDLIVGGWLGILRVAACQTGKHEDQQGWEQVFHGGFLWVVG
jgi:hypothetical protein